MFILLHWLASPFLPNLSNNYIHKRSSKYLWSSHGIWGPCRRLNGLQKEVLVFQEDGRLNKKSGPNCSMLEGSVGQLSFNRQYSELWTYLRKNPSKSYEFPVLITLPFKHLPQSLTNFPLRSMGSTQEARASPRSPTAASIKFRSFRRACGSETFPTAFYYRSS